jgi:hypothetical protein
LIHITQPSFFDPIFEDGSVMNTVLGLPPQKNSVEASLILLEAYDTSTKAYDHQYNEVMDRSKSIDERRPMAIVGYHRAFSSELVCNRKELMRLYCDKDVFKNFGINFLDFMDQTRTVIEDMFETCEQIAKDEQERMELIKQGLDEAKGKLSQK